jgi:hypothetical protein
MFLHQQRAKRLVMLAAAAVECISDGTDRRVAAVF